MTARPLGIPLPLDFAGVQAHLKMDGKSKDENQLGHRRANPVAFNPASLWGTSATQRGVTGNNPEKSGNAKRDGSRDEETPMHINEPHLGSFVKSLFRPLAAWTAGVGLALVLGTPAAAPAQNLNDGSGAFQTGRYRDLFAEQGHSPTETKAKIDKAFAQFFHGDALSERVYFEAGSNANGPLAYLTDWANNDARTEGMSYGMMIAVQMDKKREFDALWNWSCTYMLITDPENPNVGYFAWSMNTDGTPRSTGPAPDGEEYYAMALLFAARRWGNGQGIYNYQQ